MSLVRLAASNLREQRGASGYLPWGDSVPPDNSMLGGSAAGVQVSEKTALQVAAVYGSTGAARNLRAEYRIPSSKKVKFVLKPGVTWVQDHLPTFTRLINAEEVSIESAYHAPAGVPRVLTGLGELYMPLDGVVDAASVLMGATIEA